MSGRAGNDTLIGDDADIMTGGDGNDKSAVARDFAREQVAAQIVDFNMAEDALKIVGTASSISSIVYVFDSAQGGVVASVGLIFQQLPRRLLKGDPKWAFNLSQQWRVQRLHT